MSFVEPFHRASHGASAALAEGAAPRPPRTVLMIAYAFPPEGYVGGRRTLKYCKYLGQFGWRPIVITIKPRSSAFQDERLTRQIPADVEVHRTRDVDGVDWMTWASTWWRRVRGGSSATAGVHASATADERIEVRPGRVERVKHLVERLLLDTPDSHILWVPLAFLRGARMLLTQKVDVIYASSPPHLSHLVGPLLAKCFRKPHVVDFRDPWVIDGDGADTAPDRIRRWQVRARRAVVTNAARVTVVSPGEPEELRTVVPDFDYGRVAVLTNGYDPDDFPPDEPIAPDPRRFTITHAGTIYRDTGRVFFQAIERLIERAPDIRGVLRVNLVGDIDPSHVELIARLEAAGVVRALGLQPHHLTLALMRSSDVLVLLQRGGTSRASHLPAKLFEYLYLGKPIFALGAEGSLREILSASGLGFTAEPDDVEAVAESIRLLYRNLRFGLVRLQPNRAYIEQFERRTLTERLARVLDEAAEWRRQQETI